MSRIFFLGSLERTELTSANPAIVKMAASVGSGDLLISVGESYQPAYYGAEVVALQGPTISGPFTPVPASQPLPMTENTAPGVVLVPISWSMPWLTVTIASVGGQPTLDVSVSLVVPGGNFVGNKC